MENVTLVIMVVAHKNVMANNALMIHNVQLVHVLEDYVPLVPLQLPVIYVINFLVQRTMIA